MVTVHRQKAEEKAVAFFLFTSKVWKTEFLLFFISFLAHFLQDSTLHVSVKYPNWFLFQEFICGQLIIFL
jgi:hypothetical protein